MLHQQVLDTNIFAFLKRGKGIIKLKIIDIRSLASGEVLTSPEHWPGLCRDAALLSSS